MRVLIATDAWHPQVNGVVRTLTSLAASAKALGVSIEFLTPDGFPLRRASDLCEPAPRAAEPARDRAPHRRPRSPTRSISRPKVRSVLRRAPIAGAAACRSPRATRRGFPNTSRRASPIPESLSYAVLRRFHGAAAVTMVSTLSLMAELRARGFQNLRMWTRGVDTDLFAPRAGGAARPAASDLPYRGTRCGREEPRSFPVARPARLQGRGRRRAAGDRATRPFPGRRSSSACARAPSSPG